MMDDADNGIIIIQTLAFMSSIITIPQALSPPTTTTAAGYHALRNKNPDISAAAHEETGFVPLYV